jgi:hypothetical protein
MKLIPLSNGHSAIVDDADFVWLSKWRWYAIWNRYTRSFYAYRPIKLSNGQQRSLLMHRAILGLEYGDKRQGDHINHDTLDQRRSNLRIVTNQENQFNLKSAKGYSYCKRDKRYLARIKVNGKARHLGSYKNPEDARRAYIEAKRKVHRYARQQA